MSHTAPQRHDVAAGETRNFALSFADVLDSGELLTGTPTAADNSPDSPEVLTISSVAVNTAQLTVEGETIPIGEAVQGTIAGFVSGVTYTIKETATTDSTPAQTLIGYILIDTE